MITWGYIKEATLAKMDLSSDEAIDQGLLNKMPYYANEALTEITSAIKARSAYANFEIARQEDILNTIAECYGAEAMYFAMQPHCDLTIASEKEIAAYKLYNSFVYTGSVIKMPDDFVAWSDAINLQMFDNDWVPLLDTTHVCRGNTIIFNDKCFQYQQPASVKIAYKAKWFTFTPTTPNDTVLDIPDDILVCLPSYIASQLFKIDDEQKSSIYRNEYEMALARIHENEYCTNKTFNNRGDW